MKRNNWSGLYMVQLAIGLYFFLTGVIGVIGYDSGKNQLINSFNKAIGNNTYLPLIISLALLIIGLFLIGILFFSVKNQVIYIVVFILWIVYIIYNYFTDGLLKPDLLTWLHVISKDLIILAGLWAISIKK